MQEWHYRWASEVLRVLKPGGHLLAFGGTRTFHRLACAVEDAGFEIRGGEGTASRFFYCAKASRRERGEGNTHPTVKPLALMRYLVRLVTPPGGIVLDPFCGSGTTMLAARDEGFHGIGIEMDDTYCKIIAARLCAAKGEDGALPRRAPETASKKKGRLL
jgi:DNA modification methylase